MQLPAMIVNFIYCLIEEVVTLPFMYFGYKWFDRFATFDTSDQLAKDNRAVGLKDDISIECRLVESIIRVIRRL